MARPWGCRSAACSARPFATPRAIPAGARGLKAFDGAAAAMEEMREAGHHVFICTSPLSNAHWCVPEKLAWVEHHLGGSWLRRTVISADKTLVGDRLQPCILVDDRPEIKGVASPDRKS